SADWFRLEQESGLTPSRAWALTMMRRSRFLALLTKLFAALLKAGNRSGPRALTARRASAWSDSHRRWADVPWYALLAPPGALALWKTASFVLGGVPPAEIGHVVILGLITLLR